MYLAMNDDEAPKFEPGNVVKVKKDRVEMKVVSHQGGTVRCEIVDGGKTVEQNFSAAQLELVRSEA